MTLSTSPHNSHCLHFLPLQTMLHVCSELHTTTLMSASSGLPAQLQYNTRGGLPGSSGNFITVFHHASDANPWEAVVLMKASQQLLF